MPDFTSYQTADTAWRFHTRKLRAWEKLKTALDEAAKAKQELEYLEQHPPLWHLFNWSA